MASRQEIAAVYAAAVVQGVALVTFPAVSAILTSPAHYGLTPTQYGGMFVPQAVMAILASLLGASLARRLGGRWMLLGGLGADVAAMALLFASQFVAGRHPLAFYVLLAATGFLGCGFGLVVPALNTLTAAFFPQRVDGAILTLNAILGVGTALAPVFALIFVKFGCWWGLPIFVGVVALVLTLLASRLPLSEGDPAPAVHVVKQSSRLIPPRFWSYAAFTFVYGVCETMNGNWAGVYLSTDLGATASLAALALTIFWVSVTGGRVLFAVGARWFPSAWTYRTLPFILALAFVAVAAVPRGEGVLALVGFGFAGLGCSALLPLAISFAQEELTTMGAAVAGGLIGFYQMGYGVGAFGVGPLQTWWHLSLGNVYGATTILASALAALAYELAAGLNRPCHSCL